MMTKFDELPAAEKRYIQMRMAALGVDPRLIPDDAIDTMLENYNPPDSAFHREYRANEIISADRRKRAEAAGPLPVALPTEDERKDFAKRFNLQPQHVKTVEQDAAERLAAEQLEQFQTAAEAKNTFALIQIGDDKNNPHWAEARRKVSEYFPSYDSWKD